MFNVNILSINFHKETRNRCANPSMFIALNTFNIYIYRRVSIDHPSRNVALRAAVKYYSIANHFMIELNVNVEDISLLAFLIHNI